MKILLSIPFLLFGILNLHAQSIENQLFELPDLIFKEIKKADGFEAVYELRVKQPVDHHDPSKGHFYQRAFLSHKGFDRPTVLVTEGYTNTRNRIYELTELIGANQISVEHRFFGESMPDSLNYGYLNLKQATADLHHIKQLFKNIYKGKWLSTGISKGGATTIFYRYFYPDDVDVSVPFVAPINKEFEDKRLYTFLDTIGSDECRRVINNFQKRILENREKVLPLLDFYSEGAGVSYDYLSLEEAFEFAVLEYPFSFWQYGHDCSKIPDSSVSIETALKYLLEVSDITFFSDRDIEFFGSHYYQSAEEMGYYGYETEDFATFLKALPIDSNPHATFLPDKMKVEFDDTLLKKVHKWLDKNGNQFIYINGAIDTWSATAIRPNDKVDALWFFMEGKHHGNARISNMDENDKQLLIATLEKWLSIEIPSEKP